MIRRAEVQPLEQLFLEVGVGGFSVRYIAAYDAPISEQYAAANPQMRNGDSNSGGA
jgi:hypothetical protein